MGASRRTWSLLWPGRNIIDPRSSRKVSMIRTDTRALIQIANRIDRTLSSASVIVQQLDSASDDLHRDLAVAENQLTASILGASSLNFGVRVIEQEVIRPVLQSTVLLSALAHEAVDRAVALAALDVHV